ncbi:MAG: respiratory nitrate reductase subunit gamma [Myxococcota bacterium]|nr:respiratory nitrate reductase subunit gamma [Myxococcota bacterium]
MNEWLHIFFFQVFPYICVTVFVLGSWIRFDRDQFSWRSSSSEMMRKRQLVIGSNIFHLAVLPLLVGHVVGMLTPVSWQHAMGITIQQHALAEFVMGGLAGLVCFVGALILLHRRLFDRRILRTSSWSDLFILILIVVQLGMGMATLPHSWEDQKTGYTLLHASQWAQDMVTFQPDAWTLILPIPFVYKAHIVMGLILVLITPFTRLVHIWSVPIWYLGRAYQVVRVPYRKGGRRRPDEWQSA